MLYLFIFHSLKPVRHLCLSPLYFLLSASNACQLDLRVRTWMFYMYFYVCINEYVDCKNITSWQLKTLHNSATGWLAVRATGRKSRDHKPIRAINFLRGSCDFFRIGNINTTNQCKNLLYCRLLIRSLSKWDSWAVKLNFLQFIIYKINKNFNRK